MAADQFPAVTHCDPKLLGNASMAMIYRSSLTKTLVWGASSNILRLATLSLKLVLMNIYQMKLPVSLLWHLHKVPSSTRSMCLAPAF